MALEVSCILIELGCSQEYPHGTDGASNSGQLPLITGGNLYILHETV